MNLLTKILLVIFILFSVIIRGQNDSLDYSEPLKHGIEFQINKEFTLSSFLGSSIAYRYLIDKTDGLRFLLSTQISKNDINHDVQSDNNQHATQNLDNTVFNIKLSTHYIYSLMNRNKFQLIIGGGPMFLYYKSSNENKADSKTSSQYYSIITNTVWNVGIDLFCGVEYYITENIALSGEYSLAFYYSHGKNDHSQFQDTSIRLSRTNDITNNYSFKDNGVVLGLTVFF